MDTMPRAGLESYVIILVLLKGRMQGLTIAEARENAHPLIVSYSIPKNTTVSLRDPSPGPEFSGVRGESWGH